MCLAEETVPKEFRISDPLPYGQTPIDYLGSATDNPVGQLKKKLELGEVELSFDPKFGYLKSLLKALKVPVESQVLVFSKTSVNVKLIEPKNPRAVYFNDSVYIGWIPNALSIEISAVDTQKGGLFYTLNQDGERPPQLSRKSRCLSCHAGTTTLQVPGHMVRSFLTDKNGKPIEGYSRITHETDFSKRFGGWYVTGSHAQQPHMGNLFGEEDRQQHKKNPHHRGTVKQLDSFFDVNRYLSPHSDIVAQLVLQHQVHGHNLLTRVNYETRFKRFSDAEDQLVRYLLCVDEAPLPGPIIGSSGYARWFESNSDPAEKTQAFRKLNLKTRLLENQVSFLITSPAFKQLPAESKKRIYHKLHELLAENESRQLNLLKQSIPEFKQALKIQ